MEVDRIFYIFGSFARKKEKRKSLQQTSISAGNSPIHAGSINQRPSSQNLDVAPRTSAYEDVGVLGGRKRDKEWDCGLCRKEMVEPRLLDCLHNFCTRCLQGLHQEGEAEMWSEVDNASIQPERRDSASGGGSAGSGYESDIRQSGSDGSWDHKPKKYGIITRKISGKNVHILICPTCSYETTLPLGGVSALPLNYVLLRKMVTTEHGDSINVLCDLCNSDNKAERECLDCLVSVCSSCSQAHMLQTTTAQHCLRPLDPGPPRYCSQHTSAELNVYCATCQQVVCRECVMVYHVGHAASSAARAAGARARLLRDASDRASHVPAHVQRALTALNLQALENDSQAARVVADVHRWAEQYKRAVEAHTRALCASAIRARHRAREAVEEKSWQLEGRATHAVDAVKFAEELLSSGREEEVLYLSGSVLRRLELLSELPVYEARCELKFAPLAPATHDPTLFGRLLTSAADPEKCVFHTEGLQDLRVDGVQEAILELRDSNGERIWCGGDQVCGYLRRCSAGSAPAWQRAHDAGDGRHALRLRVSAPGAYLLAVTLNDKPIKGSPFSCAARVSKAHSGQYHCCAFCSSGGKRTATCGCGATMPGGYKGCGHGHPGHPGSRHWSCCGATERKGLCTKKHSQLYQFSL